MPFITLTGGLTIKIPTRGTTDWDETFLQEFAEPISDHDHTGNGRGAQLGAGSLIDDAVDDRKMRLRNNEYLRSRDAAASGDVDIIKANLDDEIELGGRLLIDEFKNKTPFTLLNNQAAAVDVTPVLMDSAKDKLLFVRYVVERLGTADLYEHGVLQLRYNGVDFDITQRKVEDAGIAFSITAAGQLQYTSTDNAGSTANSLHIMLTRLGD